MNELTALATGILIHHREEGDHLRGRIVLVAGGLLERIREYGGAAFVARNCRDVMQKLNFINQRNERKLK